MTDEHYMRLAIEQALASREAGGMPIGAVLVRQDEVLAQGHSLVWPRKDPTAHAETECIRAACIKLQTLDLTGCTLYSTLESCSMCLGSAGWANLSKIVFGAYQEDIPPNPYEISDYHAEDHGKLIILSDGTHLEVAGGVLRSECAELMSNIEQWTPKETV